VHNVANSPLPNADITGEQDYQDWLRNVADEWYKVTEEFSNDQLMNTQLVRYLEELDQSDTTCHDTREF